MDGRAMISRGLSRLRFGRRGSRRWHIVAVLGIATGSLALSASLYGGPAALPGGDGDERRIETVTDLLDRATRAGSALAGVEEYIEAEVAPMDRVLMRYRNEPELTRRIALALTREATSLGLEPRVLLAVLLVENPWLEPNAHSSVGAVGLMQVMPLHEGRWGCEGDLESIETNICYGARIFAHYYRQVDGDVERALLRYNGCVRGTNTPDCKRYPYHVYARAGYAAVLEWLDAGIARAAAP